MYFTSEVAAIVKTTPRTITNWINQGIIAAERIGTIWRIPGVELKRFILKTQRKSDGLEYHAFKYPWMGYMIYLLIEHKNNQARVCEAAARYKLLTPSAQDMEVLWASLRLSAPARIRQRMDSPTAKMPTLEAEDFREWVSTLGIMGLYQHAYFPCLDLLEDNSDVRACAEVLFCGRLTYAEIADILFKQYNFKITEEALQFFGTYFFNTLPYSTEDIENYLSRINSTESFAKRQAWGNPEQARLVMSLPVEADILTSAHKIAALAGANTASFISRGPSGLEMASKSCEIWNKACERIAREEKARREREEAAKAEASKTADNTTNGFTPVNEEPKDFEDLEQPAMDEQGEEPPTAEPQAEAS